MVEIITILTFPLKEVRTKKLTEEAIYPKESAADVLYVCIPIRYTQAHTHPPQYFILTLSNSDLKLINLQNTNLFPMTGIIIQAHALASYYLSCSNGCAQQNVIFPNVTVSYEYLSSLMHLTSHEV